MIELNLDVPSRPQYCASIIQYLVYYASIFNVALRFRAVLLVFVATGGGAGVIGD